VIDDDVSMIKDIIDRVDGKPRQNIGLDGGEENKPILLDSVSNKILREYESKLQNMLKEPKNEA
jgi:hypothetical protein